MDPIVHRSLDNFGFAQVIVVLKSESLPAETFAAAATRRATRRPMPGAPAVPPVLDLFLPEAPPSVAALATTNTVSRNEIRPRHYFPRLSVAIGYVDQSGAEALDAHPQVEEVQHAEHLSRIPPVRLTAAKTSGQMTWGLRRLGVEKLWRQGITGQGVRVGHLDTGVDAKHPALRGRVKGFMELDFDGNRVPNARPHDTDEFGHGTHTAGTLCGGKIRGMAIGVAPEAELYSGLVIEGGNAPVRVLAGMEWVLEIGVRVLNMSLGFRGYTPFFLAITRKLREQEVLPVFAIGNEGAGTSRSPGNYPPALSVGAIDSRKRVADFSSSVEFNRSDEPRQPNVVAPGVNVISAKLGGGVCAMDGTSMATPHVAGVAALLLQARPDATVAQLEEAIQQTCDPLPNEDPTRYGFGLVNPVRALAYLTKSG